MGIKSRVGTIWNNVFGRERDSKNASAYTSRIQLERIKQDIESWRNAVIQAEAAYYPQRVKMQQLFLDTVLNDHVFACMDRRKNMTLLKERMITNEKGEEDEVLSGLVRKKWFTDFLGYLLDANFYGYSLIALGDIVNDEFPNIEILKRHHISPDRFVYAPYTQSISGWNFMDPNDKDEHGNSLYDWTIYVPTKSESGISKCGYGLLYRAGKCEIFLRKNITWNADFIEMFGHPTRVAKSSKTDGEEYNRLEAALSTAGARHYMIIDPTDDIEFVQPTSAGKGTDFYGSFEERMEKKISKIILGHADALDSTPGKLGNQGNNDDSLSKALQEVESIDNTFAEEVINSVLFPKMRALGFKIPEMYKFSFKNSNEKEEIRKQEDESNQVTATIVKTLKDAGYKVDPKYIEDRTGIKVEVMEDKPEPNLLKKPEPLVTNPNLPKRVRNLLNNIYK
jgi:phage gp29-like protein